MQNVSIHFSTLLRQIYWNKQYHSLQAGLSDKNSVDPNHSNPHCFLDFLFTI